ncbi:MAG: FadR family transcriptional regulator [Streptosporangiaceae bacterium]|nr:FadR family transcriptional regulator [Streptosporangiaceae bacterium]MBV9855425.1 FadR family transcriptional regulator [Streptosporangiaceae bacterium]
MNAVTGNSTVRVPKAGEMVASQLRRQIVLGELREGDQLPSESVLMEEFGVSRPTLREAFRILEAEGAITVRRGVRGGARVQVPDAGVAARHVGLVLQHRGTLLSDVYDIRAVLEPAAARMAARRRTSADLARLQDVLDRERESIDDPGASFAADAEFHRLIVELSGSETLQVLTAMVTDIIREGDRAYADSHDWQHEQELAKIAIRAHTRLVELIRKRNGEEAEEHWRKHLAESAKIVLGDRTTATVVELLS